MVDSPVHHLIPDGRQAKVLIESLSEIIMSTGAVPIGWLQSIYAGASSVVKALGGHIIDMVVYPGAHLN